MLGVDAFTAILHPGQAAILAVGAIRELPTVRDGVLVARSVVRLRLTCDHRVLYGADAAAFLDTLARHVEAPLSLA
jgi:pyruvate dehydrogenase E2 component (dihydrolipoamide acetyltransferase)